MPFANEHAARQTDPGRYERFRRSRPDGWPAGLEAVWGILSANQSEIQSIRADAARWTVDRFRGWLDEHGFKTTIEKATGKMSCQGPLGPHGKNREHSSDIHWLSYARPVGHAALLRVCGACCSEAGVAMLSSSETDPITVSWPAPAWQQLEAYSDEHGNLCVLRDLPLGEEPPTELVLFTAGVNPTTKGEVLFDEQSAADSKAAYEAKRQELLPWDYNHGMLSLLVTPEGSKAAGWFRPVWAADGSLVASDIQWTPACHAAIKDREYRHYSPAVKLGKGRRVERLVNAAVCNLPATIGQRAMVASETMPGSTGATVEDNRDIMSTELLKLLGAETEAGAITTLSALQAALGAESFPATIAAAKKLKTQAEQAAILATEVTKLEGELTELRDEIESGKQETLIAKLHDEGKLSEAAFGWARTLTYEQLEQHGELAQVDPKKRGGHDPASGDTVVLTDAQREAARVQGLTDAEYIEALKVDEQHTADRAAGRAPRREVS